MAEEVEVEINEGHGGQYSFLKSDKVEEEEDEDEDAENKDVEAQIFLGVWYAVALITLV